MPFELSQEFHKAMWGSQQDSQDSGYLYPQSQNETWQNDSKLSQSLLGNGPATSKADMFPNRTIDAVNGNKQEPVYTGPTMSQMMPLAPVSNKSNILAKFKANQDEMQSSSMPAGAKYTIPMWTRGMRGGNLPTGNLPLQQTQHQMFGPKNSSLQDSIQAKRMEAQQRDVKEYLTSLIGSISQMKQAFILGQQEAVSHVEQFVTSTLVEKLLEKNTSIQNCIEQKLNRLGEELKLHVVAEYGGVISKVNDKQEFLEKYCVNEMGKTQQLQKAISDTLSLLTQVHEQVSCVGSMLESAKDDKSQNILITDEIRIKSDAQNHALRLEINKCRSKVDQLIDVQEVIREDMADNNQRSTTSFKEVQLNLGKILGNVAGPKSYIDSNSKVKNRSRNYAMNIRNEDQAEISTYLESRIINASRENRNGRNDNGKLSNDSVLSSKPNNLSRSYTLWDLAAKPNLQNAQNISPIQSQGKSTQQLPSLRTSTPKIDGGVNPNSSRKAQQKEQQTKRATANVDQVQPNNIRPNKRAELKKQRLLRGAATVAIENVVANSKYAPPAEQIHHVKRDKNNNKLQIISKNDSDSDIFD